MTEPKGKRGRPKGTLGPGKYGVGVKTKVVRVPEQVADNMPQILENFERVKALLDDWEDRIKEAAEASGTGKPSPRYQRAVELLQELRELI